MEESMPQYYMKRSQLVASYTCTSRSDSIIGRGNFGTVRLATRTTDGVAVAAKIFKKTGVSSWGEDQLRVVPKEIEALIRCQGIPNVIRLHNYSIFFLQHETRYCLIMDFAPNFTALHRVIVKNGPLSEVQARHVVRQLVATLLMIHDKGFLHGDVKMENILFNSRTNAIRLVDFGSAMRLHEADYSTPPESPLSSPPEFFLNGKYNGKCAEVWAVGVLLHFMLIADYPFHRVEEIKANTPLHLHASLSETCEELLLRCLHPSPSNRPTLWDILNHPWTNTRM